MNRYFFTLIALLFVGMTGAYLYQHHSLAAIRAHFPGAAAAVKPMALQEQCGCVADTDEAFPRTPQQLKQAKIDEKREERAEDLHDKQTMLRLHRLVRTGTSREQVERLMGEPDMSGTPIVAEGEHPGDDADYYGNIEVAYSANGSVTWVGSI